MIRNFLKKKLQKSIASDVRNYINWLLLDDEKKDMKIAMNLGSFYFVYTGLRKKIPQISKIIEDGELSDKEISNFITALNSLENQLKKNKDVNVAGINFFIQNLRALIIPDLNLEMTNFWKELSNYDKEVQDYLLSTVTNGTENQVQEAISLIGLTPKTYK